MKKRTELICNIVLGVISIILVISVVHLVLTKVKNEFKICANENGTYKVGLQEFNCLIDTIFEEIQIGNKCYINCSVPINAI